MKNWMIWLKPALAAALGLLCLALFMERGLADPHPPYCTAEPVSATSIRIRWGTNSHAEQYLVMRTNAGTIAVLPPGSDEYLDTGLTPGMPYVYHVAAVVGGEYYWALGETPIAMPMDPPASLAVTAWRRADSSGGLGHLEIDLAWEEVEGAVGYEFFVSVAGGGYTPHSSPVTNSTTVVFPLPDEATQYFFKVRGTGAFYVPEADETDYFPGPFSPVASVTVPAYGGAEVPGYGFITPPPLVPRTYPPVTLTTPFPIVTIRPMPVLPTPKLPTDPRIPVWPGRP